MSAEDPRSTRPTWELQPPPEYRDVVSLFTHVVETERRFYLANSVDVKVRSDGGEVFSISPCRTPGSGTSTALPGSSRTSAW